MSSAQSVTRKGMLIDIEKNIEEEPNSFDFVNYVQKTACSLRGNILTSYKDVVITFEDDCALSEHWCSHNTIAQPNYGFNPKTQMCSEHNKRHVNLTLKMLHYLEMNYTIIMVNYLNCVKNRYCNQWIPDLTLVFNRFRMCRHSLSTYYLDNLSRRGALQIITCGIKQFQKLQPNLRVTRASKCPCS